MTDTCKKMNDVIVTKEGVFNCQVCAVKSLNGEEAARITERQSPAGTSLGWVLSDRGGIENPMQCADFGDRWHWLLDC